MEENSMLKNSNLNKVLKKVWGEVLHSEGIRESDNFFELGGDFYKAVKITAYLKECGLKLGVEDLLKNPTIKGVIPYISEAGNQYDMEVEDPGTKGHLLEEKVTELGCKSFEEFLKHIKETAGKNIQIQDIYELSPVQERMYMHSFFFRRSNANYLQYSFSLYGKVDIKLFEESFNIVIKRHDILRTLFTSKKVKKPVQVVLKGMYSPIYYEDISLMDKDAKKQYIEQIKRKDEEKGFNLNKGNLIRMSVLKTNEEAYRVIWSFHHILLDGWGIEIVCNEIFNAYKSLKGEKSLSLGKAYRYSNYIKWLQNQSKEDTLAYWKRYLLGYDREVKLRNFGNQVGEGNYKRNEVIFAMTLEKTNLIRNIAKANCISLDAVFQAIWGIVLQALFDVDDVIYFTVVSGRPSDITGIEKMVGFFVNTNPVRVKCSDTSTFTELIKMMHEASIESKKHEYYPIKGIQEKIGVKMDLTDNVLIVESYPLDEDVINLSQEGYYEFDIGEKEVYQQTGFDFNLVVIPSQQFKIALNYNSLIYGIEFISRLEESIKKLIDAIVEDPFSTTGRLKKICKV